jgi:hypothetical protein
MSVTTNSLSISASNGMTLSNNLVIDSNSGVNGGLKIKNNGIQTLSAWGTSGSLINIEGITSQDTSTSSSGVVTNAVFNSFDQPTLSATNSSITTTHCANVYIANAPIAGTNQTITNSYALLVANGISKFNGPVYNNSGLRYKIDGVVTNTTLTNNNLIINVDASSGNIIITLPNVSTNDGRIYYIRKSDSSANTVTIGPSTSDFLDGIQNNTVVFTSKNDRLNIVCFGNDGWFTM